MKQVKPQIRIETFIEAAPEQVWKAITNKEMVSQWLMETNIEPKKGFKAYFKMKPMPGFDGNISSTVIDVQENRIFEYSWEGGWMKQPTTIRFTLDKKPNGTQLILEHWGFEGFLGNMLRRMMSGGWKKKITQQIAEIIKIN